MRSPLCLVAALATLTPPVAGIAQPYPVKSVRLVVPFPPGASNDVIARLIGQKLAENLRQPMVIDNRGGAGGALGAEIVAKAPADGYTLLATSTTYTTNAAVHVMCRPERNFVFLRIV